MWSNFWSRKVGKLDFLTTEIRDSPKALKTTQKTNEKELGCYNLRGLATAVKNF